METQEKQLTGEESLRIITDMINRAKTNVRQGSFHLLFWGWLILFCSLSEYLLLKFTSWASPWYIWYLVIPGALVSLIYGFVKGRREHVHTYADMIYMWTWIGFMFEAILLFIFLIGKYELIPSFILLIVGLPAFISGFIIKFRPLILGGISFWIFALVAHFIPSFAPLAVPVAILTGYLIPGYLLRRKNGHGTV